ncbi:MAG: hypothetical protein M1812_006930 [Candelaria pacifica]|nr:MAG: hypothetical protein M1812_006930 [Candelaria pacifica]
MDRDLATWASVKSEIQSIQDRCVKTRGLGGMATAGLSNRIWVSIYNVGSYIDGLQVRAQKHGMIAGTMAALGDPSALNECRASDANQGEAPGLGPGSLYDYEDQGSWEVPGQPTERDGYNAYCREGRDCACGYCRPGGLRGKGLLLGILETAGGMIGTCQSEVDFG